MKSFLKLLFLSFLIISTIGTQAQTIDIDQEKTTIGGRGAYTANYKAKADGLVFEMRFATHQVYTEIGFSYWMVEVFVSVEEYEGEIQLISRDRNKIKLENTQNGYRFYGRDKDLMPIVGLQMDNSRIMFDESVHSNIYGDLRRLRKQIVKYYSPN